VMNYLLPQMGELSMHCSANVGARGDGAILFGLSGTGKTTLSADPDRQLIGDDEHAWTGNGVSNFEDGCYAKLIDLDKQAEPVIAAALSMAGTIIENVPPAPGKTMEECDPQELDLTDSSITENTRFSYPLACNPDVAPGAKGPHPETIVLLTADAFGVLPPVAVLEARDVMYHFISGFTAKLAGTEVGITEPQAAFSACFGAPFMSQKASVYAKLLSEKMAKHDARCILLNTGWGGGPYGVGKRISIDDTRALLNAALAGELHSEDMEYEVHPVFGLKMPKSCPGVDAQILNPRNTWADKEAYDTAADKLRDMFRANFDDKGFADLGIEPVM
ncbi:MAG: phosphoenolpyruvate carboxykinase (ATP), partial [Planctomycetota bacterium]|nr:phosphoenolpyruvate carboxykinase (ATP) [Planctomycetota bacterium]